MPVPLISLILFTVLLWGAVVVLHQLKNRLTLIPLYSLLAALTVGMHHISDLGFSVQFGDLFFLVGSVSFFTSLMLGLLLLYIFDGPRASRIALVNILGISILYVLLVLVMGFMTDTSKWVVLTFDRYISYIWSIGAIFIDGLFIMFVWELLSRVKVIPIFFKVFIVVLGVYVLDALIYVTGVFGLTNVYWTVLEGNLVTRVILALVITPFITVFLKQGRYSEEKRDKPKNLWDIVNFRSDLEVKVSNMEQALKYEKELRQMLQDSKEKFEMAVAASHSGIWEWDVVKKQVHLTPQYYALLGYEQGIFEGDSSRMWQLVHPDDYKMTYQKIYDECLKQGKPYSVEHRLKTSDGKYRWFQEWGIAKFDDNGKPIKMIGSIIDIDNQKKLVASYEEKLKELEKLNKIMIDREVQMSELKAAIKSQAAGVVK